MSEVTVKQLATEVGTPVERLLDQLKSAGVKAKDESAIISDKDKIKLLKFLRENKGASSGAAKSPESEGKQRITLKRKSTSELKLGVGKGSRTKTVSVEVRKRRSFAKPGEAEAKAAEAEEAQAAAEEEAKQAAISEQAEADAAVAEDKPAEEKTSKQTQAEKADEKVAEASEVETVAEEVAETAESEQPEEPEEVESEPEVAEEPAAAEPEMSDLERQQAEARARIEAERQKTSDERRKSAEKAKAQREKEGPKTGRKRVELHVAADKRGKRKSKAKKGRTVKVETQHGFEKPTAPVIHEVHLPELITVGELAQKMAVKAGEVLKVMMGMGVMATINQPIDQDTAVLVVEEMGHIPKVQDKADAESEMLDLVDTKGASEEPRPPVVTIMGHVDHGKTSLLDYIRKAKVAEGEAGGITQHIGAYHVKTNNGIVTFLDTPGHAAFTKMRARGAQVTDIVVLVVAADDGVMPQTKEAIQHARAAEVPMVVAITKCDRENADPEKVRSELSKEEVISEEWGGDTQFVEVSAMTGQGVDALLDALTLQAEVLELKAPVDCPAQAVVIESRVDKGRGPVVTALIRQGTLKQGDSILAGSHFGRVRAMLDERGQTVKSVTPSFPVEFLGLSGAPDAGEDLLVLEDERKVREVAELRESRQRENKLAQQQAARLEQAFTRMGEGEFKDLNILLKTDVQGSAEAINEALQNIASEEVQIKVVTSGVGGISESDIDLAMASNAIIIGFNVRADSAARKNIAETGVDVRYYSVIYELLDDIKDAVSGLLGTETRENIVGLAEVKDVFRASKWGDVAGCLVVEGFVSKGLPIRVLRDNVVIYEGELESLRRHKDNVEKVESGTECGIAVKNYDGVQKGDQIEVFERTEVQRTVD